VGTRYSREELERIKALTADGLTNREIAIRLGRTEAGIRNLRYRFKLEADTRTTLQSLLRKEEALRKKIDDLEWPHISLSSEIKSLENRKEKLTKAIHLDEEALKERLTIALTELKH